MTVDTLRKLRKLFALLVAAVAAVLLLVSAFVLHNLYQSQQRYQNNAEETSRNLAISLENFLHSHFQEVDLAMRRAASEFRTLHSEQRFDDAGFSAFLRGLKERLPQADAVRGSDRNGRVIYGEKVDLSKPQDLSIREFYQRSKTERELVFGVPVKSRISGEWVFPLMYALTLPDGSFGGTAYVNLNNSRITELFSSLNVDQHGVIILLDQQRRVLHRYPESREVQIGSQIALSPETSRVLASGQRRATYKSISVRDGRERVVSVERIGGYPVFVLVGLAGEDFLAPWRKEARDDAIFLATLYVLAASLLLGVRAALRKQSQALHQLVLKDQALQGSLAALTRSEQRWRSLTEGLPQMVWTLTPARRFEFLSHHWQEFTGIDTATLLAGAAWFDLLHPDDRSRVDAAWAAALALGGEFRCDCRLRGGDGHWRIFEHHALPQRDPAGRPLCWVGSSTDITAAREAHAQLSQAKDAALAAGRAKSEFVANMSHEIRTPMNAVLGMLQLLQQTPLAPRQQDYAVKAESAARSLLNLLNDILDFSKVEAGKLTLDCHPFSVDKLLRDLSVILSANVGDKDVEVLFQIDPAIPKWVSGDALRLQQILLNLSGNAIKFTAHGEVLLSVRLLAHDAAGLRLAFAIRDTGIGISAEQCERIFEGFSQAEASTARRYGGSGLGLAISQRLVRLMGGELDVRSAPGQGSVFEFVVVLQPATTPATLLPDPRLLQQLDCLVVDDNPSARQVLAEMARSFGWQVDTAVDGADALAALARRAPARPYDVMFVDWRMPLLDGWDTAVRIRQLLPAGAAPLIIMVTAYDREILAQKQLEQQHSGAATLDGVLVKPVTASMLFDAVADAKPGQRHGGAPATVAPSRRRLHGLRLLLVEDNPANQQVARELLGYEGAEVALANCGQAAIEAVRDGAPPDLILMDIQMPDMDGYHASRAIRAQLGWRTPPIVAMTANALASDRAAALAAGMADHVGKPFDLDQLVAVILGHTAAAGGAAAPRPLPPPPPAPAAEREPDVLDGAAALQRMGGHSQLYLRTLRDFTAEAGNIGARLHGAIEEQNLASAKPLLHVLKGLAGTVGAEQLAVLAATAEAASTDEGWIALAMVLAALPPALAAIEQLAAALEGAAAPGAAG
ncbi:response regulator [Rugamonas sp. CCM 8940]|uniref:response regulator n=1 Tax=Rugamonas sp. CCM 8940 TaxID=2765359 RepID=UPI0018F7C1D3|nr:response regulator [Rugamonas sp. CCM 8940]MBJ7313231.1 response regulator [Rugamonas sp. CCM 8940]